MIIEFAIPGRPQHQVRHRDRSQGGKYDPCKRAKGQFALLARRWAPPVPLAGPLQVDMEFYFARPKSHYRTGRYAGRLKATAPLFHTSRPDRDNLEKFVLDALAGLFWTNDARVCDGRSRKLYGDPPRTVVTITVLPEAGYERGA